MNELEGLLERGAGQRIPSFTAEDVERRVRKRRAWRRIGLGGGSLVLVVVAMFGVALLDRDVDQPVVTDGGPEPGDPTEPVDLRSELTRGGWVSVGHSDWTQPQPGEDPSGDRRTELKLHRDGRASGRLLCNSFGAGWRIDGDALELVSVIQTAMGCDPYEERVASLLRGRTTIGWSSEQPDRLRLSDSDGYIEFERIDPWFAAFDMREAIGPIGTVAVATDQTQLDDHFRANALRTDDEQMLDRGFRPVDFDRWVVVSIVIPDDACPPTLDRLDRDGSTLTPVFVQPPGGCEQPLIPKVFFVAIDRDDVSPEFSLRYPAEDPALQHGPPHGPYGGEITVRIPSSDPPG